MSDIVFGGWSDIWRTDLGYASVRSPDIRPPPQTISYTYLSCVHPADQIIQLPVNVSKVKKWVPAFSKFHHHGDPVDPLPLMCREEQNSPDLLS